MTDLEEVHKSLMEAEQDLLQAHHDLVEDPRNGVEGLDRASCSPHITDLARLAIGASSEGLTAEAWRAWIIGGLGAEAAPLLDAAETCMRASGLWPWAHGVPARPAR